MVVWEFPPEVASGVASHTDGLAHAMAAAGHDVVVFTRSHPSVSDDVEIAGVRVLRAEIALPWIPEEDLIAKTASANHHLVGLAASLGEWRPDVVHCHDWQTAWAGDVLSRLFDVALVATFHGTERTRHGGHLPPGRPSDVHTIEWWLAFRAQRIITTTHLLAREIASGFELDPDRIDVIANGIEPLWWRSAGAPDGDRDDHDDHGVDAGVDAGVDSEYPSYVLTWGRVQYEKGFQVLVRAISTIRSTVPGLGCIIAGRGSFLPELQSQIDLEGVSDLISLPGFLTDTELRSAIHRASCVVIPSLYEPFGVVALEAMAAGAPLIVAETGGLAELVSGTGAALMFEPGNAEQLAEAITQVVTEPEIAAELRRRSTEVVDATYSWNAIATRSVEIYRELSDR
jgi:glycogen(starch) synthase